MFGRASAAAHCMRREANIRTFLSAQRENYRSARWLFCSCADRYSFLALMAALRCCVHRLRSGPIPKHLDRLDLRFFFILYWSNLAFFAILFCVWKDYFHVSHPIRFQLNAYVDCDCLRVCVLLATRMAILQLDVRAKSVICYVSWPRCCPSSPASYR